MQLFSDMSASSEIQIQKRASQGFLDPIQNRALSRSVQLEAVYLDNDMIYWKNANFH